MRVSPDGLERGASTIRPVNILPFLNPNLAFKNS